MWREKNIALFYDCVKDLLHHPVVERMKEMKQHIESVSCYDHCLFVAYLSFNMCRKLNLDYRSAARGALLHDLYLQHWEETDIGRFRRLFVHPYMALENARQFDLSAMEEDIISKHMWPLTAAFPHYKESYVVSAADKIAASIEMSHTFRVLGVRHNIDRLYAMRQLQHA